MIMSKDREDRITGVMVGMAAGDALGAGYETGKPVPKSGAAMIGGGYGFAPGEWTDDTCGAIAVALGRSVPEEVAKGLLSWYWTRPPDIGITTRAVLSHAKSPGGMFAASRAHGKQQTVRPKPKGYDPGVANGSLMRTGPVCLPFLGDRRRVALAARQISDLTHFDPDRFTGDACVLWSLFIEEAITAGCVSFYGGLEFVAPKRRDYWRAVIKGVFAAGSVPPRHNSGVVGAFKAALYAVSRADSLEDGLQRAVAIGGDTDTVAAIAGSLLGAIFGASAVPAEWHDALRGWPGMYAEDLERLALDAAGL
jgi:ADP-ribosylglycohydrolase